MKAVIDALPAMDWDDGLAFTSPPVWWLSAPHAENDERHAGDCVDQSGVRRRLSEARSFQPGPDDNPEGVDPNDDRSDV